jgi:hypothetical protein
MNLPTRRTLRPICIVLGCAVLSGCGPSLGWWTTNLASQSVDPEFEFDKDRPLLVYIEDNVGGTRREQIKRDLTDRIVVLLLENRAAGRVLGPDHAVRLRQINPEFHTMSPDQIARELQARQLLLIRLTHVIDPENRQGDRAQIGASVRVRNPETGRDIWPAMTGTGQEIEPVYLTPGETRSNTRPDDVRDVLVSRLAQRIAELFYEHPAKRI